MKPGTITIWIKGLSSVAAAVCISLAGGLGQWAATGEWPNRICWVLILVTAAGQGFKDLGSFLSQSYAQYKAQPGADGKAPALELPVLPPVIKP